MKGDSSGDASSARRTQFDEILADLMRAIDSGESVDSEQWVIRHPEFARELREFFEKNELVEKLVRPLRQAAANVLHVRCPHCHNPIKLLDQAPLSDISCPSCGSSFNLVSDNTLSHDPTTRTFGHFELLDRVGVGQFGSVWKARDTKLDRTVAIKIPRNGRMDSAQTEMFLRDARAAAQLTHSNIVSVHEVGKQDDTVYIVSDFVQGATLKEWTNTKQLTLRESAELCIKIARALHHAHEAGVIHRDLKPGNIMMDADGEPHVVDFGLAKREAGEITMTVEGQILGTPAYMSPEQARGEGHTVDRRADVYSLGVILFELLTGELPFRGDKQMLIVQILKEDPPSPRKLNSSVPRDLETICLKCLEKQLNRRYKSAHELSAELGRFLGGNPVLARPLHPLGRLIRWCTRRPAVAALWTTLAVLLLTVAFGGAAVGVAQSKLRRAEEDAHKERSLALLNTLLTANAKAVPAILHNLQPLLADVEPQLLELQADNSLTESQRVRVSLALLDAQDDSAAAESVEHLQRRVLHVAPDEILVIRESLMTHRHSLSTDLWKVALEDPDASRRLRAACMLAVFDPEDRRWDRIGPHTAAQLVSVSVSSLQDWIVALRPVKGKLIEPLVWILRDRGKHGTASRPNAATALAEFLAEAPEELVELAVQDAQSDKEFTPFIERLADHRDRGESLLADVLLQKELEGASTDERSQIEKQRANAAVALFALGRAEHVWPILNHTTEPTARSYLIHQFARLGVDPRPLVDNLVVAKDVSVRRAIILSLGEFNKSQFGQVESESIVATLLEMYENDPDPGVHGAAEWVLRRWKCTAELEACDSRLALRETDGAQKWYVAGQGLTMILVPPGEIQVFASSGDAQAETAFHYATDNDSQKPIRLKRPFMISSKEVTLQQYLRFRTADHRKMRQFGPTDDCPVYEVTYFEAMEYCNWLSKTEGIPADQWYYKPDQLGKFGPRVEVVPLATGYRLPTTLEWEYAARCGAATSRFFGHSVDLLSEYAWFDDNSFGPHSLTGELHLRRLWPGALLKPNDFGLFDVHGNVWEWCHDLRETDPESRSVNGANTSNVVGTGDVRGGSFLNFWPLVRFGARVRFPSTGRNPDIGFRVARTQLPVD